MSPHFETILHPTDFSAHSQLALELACSLAREQTARLVLLHVAVPPVVIYNEQGELLPRPKDYRSAAEDQLFKLQIPDTNIRTEYRIEEGEATAAIIRVANEVKADLIVMGTQGRTGLDRLLIGSVARSVMRKAHCPVLTVKVPQRQEIVPQSASAQGQ